MTHRIAIVGAGPSGFYAADGLLRLRPDLAIDLIDRLPTPLGLVRAGVAPDHQGTKAVARQFDRMLDKPGLCFTGNIEIGRDLAWEALRAAYDAVIVATGMTRDRALGVPGEALPGVLGSFRFVGWVNGHPDHAEPPIDLSRVRRVAVIGNGNVAIDVARLLAKTPEERAKSDISPTAEAALAAAPIEEIAILGRRGPVDASFTNNELAELGRLQRAVALVAGDGLEAEPPASDPTPERLRKSKNLELLRGFAANASGTKPVALRFLFNAGPLGFAGTDRVEAVELATGRLPVDLVVTCIGYSGEPMPQGEGVFAVGWARRGPSGTIPTNRADSHAVAASVIEWLKDRAPKSGVTPPDGLAAQRVDTAGWRRIDAAETAAGAAVDRPRVKLATWDALRSVSRA